MSPSRKQIKTRAITPGMVVRQEFTLAEVSTGLGISVSTVWRWSQDKPRGTGGFVPPDKFADLLQLSRKLNRALTADDLVLGRDE